MSTISQMTFVVPINIDGGDRRLTLLLRGSFSQTPIGAGRSLKTAYDFLDGSEQYQVTNDGDVEVTVEYNQSLVSWNGLLPFRIDVGKQEQHEVLVRGSLSLAISQPARNNAAWLKALWPTNNADNLTGLRLEPSGLFLEGSLPPELFPPLPDWNLGHRVTLTPPRPSVNGLPTWQLSNFDFGPGLVQAAPIVIGFGETLKRAFTQTFIDNVRTTPPDGCTISIWTEDGHLQWQAVSLGMEVQIGGDQAAETVFIPERLAGSAHFAGNVWQRGPILAAAGAEPGNQTAVNLTLQSEKVDLFLPDRPLNVLAIPWSRLSEGDTVANTEETAVVEKRRTWLCHDTGWVAFDYPAPIDQAPVFNRPSDALRGVLEISQVAFKLHRGLTGNTDGPEFPDLDVQLEAIAGNAVCLTLHCQDNAPDKLVLVIDQPDMLVETPAIWSARPTTLDADGNPEPAIEPPGLQFPALLPAEPDGTNAPTGDIKSLQLARFTARPAAGGLQAQLHMDVNSGHTQLTVTAEAVTVGHTVADIPVAGLLPSATAVVDNSYLDGNRGLIPLEHIGDTITLRFAPGALPTVVSPTLPDEVGSNENWRVPERFYGRHFFLPTLPGAEVALGKTSRWAFRHAVPALDQAYAETSEDPEESPTAKETAVAFTRVKDAEAFPIVEPGGTTLAKGWLHKTKDNPQGEVRLIVESFDKRGLCPELKVKLGDQQIPVTFSRLNNAGLSIKLALTPGNEVGGLPTWKVALADAQTNGSPAIANNGQPLLQIMEQGSPFVTQDAEGVVVAEALDTRTRTLRLKDGTWQPRAYLTETLTLADEPGDKLVLTLVRMAEGEFDELADDQREQAWMLHDGVGGWPHLCGFPLFPLRVDNLDSDGKTAVSVTLSAILMPYLPDERTLAPSKEALPTFASEAVKLTFTRNGGEFELAEMTGKIDWRFLQDTSHTLDQNRVYLSRLCAAVNVTGAAQFKATTVAESSPLKGHFQRKIPFQLCEIDIWHHLGLLMLPTVGECALRLVGKVADDQSDKPLTHWFYYSVDKGLEAMNVTLAENFILGGRREPPTLEHYHFQWLWGHEGDYRWQLNLGFDIPELDTTDMPQHGCPEGALLEGVMGYKCEPYEISSFEQLPGFDVLVKDVEGQEQYQLVDWPWVPPAKFSAEPQFHPFQFHRFDNDVTMNAERLLEKKALDLLDEIIDGNTGDPVLRVWLMQLALDKPKVPLLPLLRRRLIELSFKRQRSRIKVRWSITAVNPDSSLLFDSWTLKPHRVGPRHFVFEVEKHQEELDRTTPGALFRADRILAGLVGATFRPGFAALKNLVFNCHLAFTDKRRRADITLMTDSDSRHYAAGDSVGTAAVLRREDSWSGLWQPTLPEARHTDLSVMVYESGMSFPSEHEGGIVPPYDIQSLTPIFPFARGKVEFGRQQLIIANDADLFLAANQTESGGQPLPLLIQVKPKLDEDHVKNVTYQTLPLATTEETRDYYQKKLSWYQDLEDITDDYIPPWELTKTGPLAGGPACLVWSARYQVPLEYTPKEQQEDAPTPPPPPGPPKDGLYFVAFDDKTKLYIEDGEQKRLIPVRVDADLGTVGVNQDHITAVVVNDNRDVIVGWGDPEKREYRLTVFSYKQTCEDPNNENYQISYFERKGEKTWDAPIKAISVAEDIIFFVTQDEEETNFWRWPYLDPNNSTHARIGQPDDIGPEHRIVTMAAVNAREVNILTERDNERQLAIRFFDPNLPESSTIAIRDSVKALTMLRGPDGQRLFAYLTYEELPHTRLSGQLQLNTDGQTRLKLSGELALFSSLRMNKQGDDDDAWFHGHTLRMLVDSASAPPAFFLRGQVTEADVLLTGIVAHQLQLSPNGEAKTWQAAQSLRMTSLERLKYFSVPADWPAIEAGAVFWLKKPATDLRYGTKGHAAAQPLDLQIFLRSRPPEDFNLEDSLLLRLPFATSRAYNVVPEKAPLLTIPAQAAGEGWTARAGLQPRPALLALADDAAEIAWFYRTPALNWLHDEFLSAMLHASEAFPMGLSPRFGSGDLIPNKPLDDLYHLQQVDDGVLSAATAVAADTAEPYLVQWPYQASWHSIEPPADPDKHDERTVQLIVYADGRLKRLVKMQLSGNSEELREWARAQMVERNREEIAFVLDNYQKILSPVRPQADAYEEDPYAQLWAIETDETIKIDVRRILPTGTPLEAAAQLSLTLFAATPAVPSSDDPPAVNLPAATRFRLTSGPGKVTEGESNNGRLRPAIWQPNSNSSEHRLILTQRDEVPFNVYEVENFPQPDPRALQQQPPSLDHNHSPAESIIPPLIDVVSWAGRPGELVRSIWALAQENYSDHTQLQSIEHGPATSATLRRPRTQAGRYESVQLNIITSNALLDGRFRQLKFQLAQVLAITPVPKGKGYQLAIASRSDVFGGAARIDDEDVQVVERAQAKMARLFGNEGVLEPAKLYLFGGPLIEKPVDKPPTSEQDGKWAQTWLVWISGSKPVPDINAETKALEDSESYGVLWQHDKELYSPGDLLKAEFDADKLQGGLFVVVRYTITTNRDTGEKKTQKEIMAAISLARGDNAGNFVVPKTTVAVLAVDKRVTLAGYGGLGIDDFSLVHPNLPTEDGLITWFRTAELQLLHRSRAETNYNYDAVVYGSGGELIKSLNSDCEKTVNVKSGP